MKRNITALRRRLRRNRVRFLTARQGLGEAAGQPARQSYAMREYNRSLKELRAATIDTHVALYERGGTNVVPPPTFRIGPWDSKRPPRWDVRCMTASEAVKELRRRGFGRNEARRAVKTAQSGRYVHAHDTEMVFC